MSEPIPPFTGRTKEEFDQWAYEHRVYDRLSDLTLPAEQYDALADDVWISIVASHVSNGYLPPRPDRSKPHRLVVSGIRIHRASP